MKNICEPLVLIVVIYCIENWIKLFRKRIGLPDCKNHSVLPTFIRIHSFHHSLSFAVTHCHFLLLVIRCHSLSLTVPLVVTRWITRSHSLYHSMSLVVTLSHSLYHLLSLSFVVTRCQSMSFDVPLVCFYKRSLFHKFLLFTLFIIKTKTKKYLV